MTNTATSNRITSRQRWFLIVWAAICCGIAGVGLHHLIVTVRHATNPCRMTYMWPNYYPIPMVNQSRLATKYRLFQYSEKALPFPPSHSISEEKDIVTDVVIFVPGSSGSYGQVRSIGSETIRKWTESKSENKLVVYTLDFDEEASGFSGVFLQDQAEFLQDCLVKVRKQHMGRIKVILVGHSMGGIVVRATLDELDRKKNKQESDGLLEMEILAVLTLSSPHAAPVVGADTVMFRLYQSLSQHSDHERLYISLAGGYRDTLVRSELVQLDSARYKRSASALTASVKEVDVSMDHLAILWCNELVSAVAEEILVVFDGGLNLALFDKIKTKKIPRVGFGRKSFELLGLSKEYGYLSDIASFAADTFSRKFLVGVFQFMFAISLAIVAFASGAGWRITGMWIVLWYASFLADAKHQSHWPVPLIHAGLCTALFLFLWGVAQLFFKALRFLMSYVHVLSFLGVLIFCQYQTSFSAVTHHYLAALLLWELINVVALALGNLAASGLAVAGTDGAWDAHHYQVLFAFAYIGSLSAWVSPALQAATLFKPPLRFVDIYPLSTEHQTRAVVHAVSLEEIPVVFKDENGTLLEVLPPVFSQQDVRNAVSDAGVFFLLLSVITLVPVLVHLWSLFYYPSFASEEKILDSEYKKIPRKAAATKKKPEQDPVEIPSWLGQSPDTSAEKGKEKTTTKKHRDRSASGVLTGAETEDGLLVFEEVEYEKKPEVVRFPNGEEIQIEDVKSEALEKEHSSDAVSLIPEESQAGPGLSMLLVQRVRTASRPLPESAFLQQALFVLAFLSSVLGSQYLFLLQFLAPICSVVVLSMSGSSRPVEKLVTKKV